MGEEQGHFSMLFGMDTNPGCLMPCVPVPSRSGCFSAGIYDSLQQELGVHKNSAEIGLKRLRIAAQQELAGKQE